ncbi:MAG: 23S rRNA (adenine(2503)-C(2))-methyltransferase RlmN [Spirochaetaceae bacterium]|nr:23S rRNA (adenine(2503)-C(2))-methyltransferase RlmN [Spirochaetaceae bacterium]
MDNSTPAKRKFCLVGMLPEEILSIPNVTPSFRAKQIFKWVASGVTSFEQMHNLPKELRNKLQSIALLRSSSVLQELKDPDGTIKLQIALWDGCVIETVLLTDSNGRKTACVSCQAGCAMGCAFCQTGRLGLARNLETSEIVEQFMFLEQSAGSLDNIVFMGMGEPMMNLEAIRKAITILTHADGRGLSARRITISTSGIIKGIYDLADNGPSLRLAVSLTTANSELREQLMPVTKGNPLPQLKQAISYYTNKTGRRCTLEAALISKTNTSDKNAQEIIEFCKGLDVHINLIPWNPIQGMPFSKPTQNECTTFLKKLEKAGLNVTLRMPRGKKISGACGQLGKIILE